MLVKFSHSQATDPRDKIYALLGIASDARSSGTLRPDYEISTGQAIRNTISFLLFQEVRDPSCLPLPMNLDFDNLLQVLPRLPEYVVSWAVLHDCAATVTATISQVSDISQIPYNFLLDDFDAYFHPLRMLVVKVLAKKRSLTLLHDSNGILVGRCSHQPSVIYIFHPSASKVWRYRAGDVYTSTLKLGS